MQVVKEKRGKGDGNLSVSFWRLSKERPRKRAAGL